MLGVSGTSSDVRHLFAREARDVRAAEAIALFCYQSKRDRENASHIRERICEGLGFLGIKLHRSRNASNPGSDCRISVNAVKANA